METGVRFWIARGWLPAEASAFANITFEAVNESPYIPLMITARLRLFNRAQQAGYTTRQYYLLIRNKYADWQLAPKRGRYYIRNIYGTPASILRNDDDGRTLAFALFNAYKEKYGYRKPSGKLTETPRKKARVSRRSITREGNAAQLIAKAQEEIKRLEFRLSHAGDAERQSFLTRIGYQQQRIRELGQSVD